MPASSAAWIVAMLSRRVGRPVHARHPHATEPDPRHLGSVRAKHVRHRPLLCRGLATALTAEGVASGRAKNLDHERRAHGKSDARQVRPRALGGVQRRGFTDPPPRPVRRDQITRLEPETAVAWEGERACGTVRLEPSGWGTQVTLTAQATEPEAVSEPEPAVEEVLEEEQQEEVVEEPELEAVEPEPEPDSEPRAVQAEPLAVQSRPKGLFARLRGWFGGRPASVVQAPPEPQMAMAPARPARGAARARARASPGRAADRDGGRPRDRARCGPGQPRAGPPQAVLPGLSSRERV